MLAREWICCSTFACGPAHFQLPRYLFTLLVHPVAKDQRTDGCQYAENHRDGLSEPDRPRNRRATQDYGCEEAEFDAVRLLILRAISAKRICCP